MGALRSLIICFAVFSKIPMPYIDWEKKDMKYIFCFLPLVGVVMGALFIGLNLLAQRFNVPETAFGIISFAVAMLLVNGGIHMDGFMDTIDALSSHKSRDDKIRILDDPHTGAFAIIYAIFYVLITAYILGTVDNLAEAVYMAIVFVFTRALVGIVAMSEDLAKNSGMLYTFVSSANKFVTAVICVVWLIASISVMEILAPVRSIITLGVVFIFVMLFQNMNRKHFGGISGDLMGYLLKLFIGGNSQGHNDLAIKAYNGIIADGKEDSIESIENADVIVNYHEFVRKIMENGKDPLEFSQNINAKAVACDEVGCGVVPMDKKQILYREAVGRSCCILAERAERVTRVICGIGVIIK